MKKLFGTDGIRGEANVWPLTPEIALAVGKALATTLPKNATAIIGGDTRRSRGILENALAAGLAAGGVNVKLAGVLPTPAIAALTRALNAHAGIVITASHNPASDNGIKIFSGDGYKLDDAQEEKIAWQVMQHGGRTSSSAAAGEDTRPPNLLSMEGERPREPQGVSWREIGNVSRMDDATEIYEKFLASLVPADLLRGMTVVVDGANGAASRVAPEIFRALGAKVEAMGDAPDGMNINDGCGALHPQKLLARVRETGSAFGVALDGDADRLVMCDANGVADGDMLIAALAASLDAAGRLAKRTVVVTSMTNLGLHAALVPRGIRVVATDVGDRYVIERMRAEGYNFGGENSGHLIFSDFLPTGDGILAALLVASFMRGETLSGWLAQTGMVLFPQQLVGIKVREKIPLEKLPLLRAVIRDAEANLGNDGRVVVRYSGTENKIRLLVEAREAAQVERWMSALRDAVGKELGTV